MDIKEYIESGILELYVFGVLTDSETAEVAHLSKQNKEIQNEILSIEKAIMTLNYSMSPKLSADNYYRIRNKIFNSDDNIIQLQTETSSSKNFKSYLGWAAALIFASGIAFQYLNSQKTQKLNQVQVTAIQKENSKLKLDFQNLLSKNNQEIQLAALVKNDICNMAIALAGQKVAPQAKAKIYWNKYSNEVYVDATDLPTPPEGMEYQIWSLKMNPLTPKSIGLLSDFNDSQTKLFAVNSTDSAEGFGITLEPKGGSLSPTMEQLYTLGKV
jgi:anti-sigma-K factor RskA